MATTPTPKGIPRSDGTDQAWGPSAVNPVAETVDSMLVAELTTQQRDLLPASARWPGRTLWERVTGGLVKLTRWDDLAQQWRSFEGVPAGIIAMWSGSATAVPDGWLLCNGQNGAPDLRDRFIVGAGGGYTVGAKGGAATVALTEAQMPVHDHPATATTDKHRHTSGMSSGPVGSGGSNSAFNNQGNGGIVNVPTTEDTHGHTVTVSNAGGGQPHENRPPYYALALIVKL